MRINPINNFNQSFTSFRVSELGAKELAKKFTENPEYEKTFVENIIKPLSNTMTNVIYDGNNNVIVNPAHNVMDYYFIPARTLWIDADYTNVLLKDSRTGNIGFVSIETQDIKEDCLDMSILENKFEIAKRVALRLDQANKYYQACHSPSDPEATLRYNENKLRRLYLLK